MPGQRGVVALYPNKSAGAISFLACIVLTYSGESMASFRGRQDSCCGTKPRRYVPRVNQSPVLLDMTRRASASCSEVAPSPPSTFSVASRCARACPCVLVLPSCASTCRVSSVRGLVRFAGGHRVRRLRTWRHMD